jgi:hypothetical protein
MCIPQIFARKDSVSYILPFIARQQLDKDVLATTNTRNNSGVVGHEISYIPIRALQHMNHYRQFLIKTFCEY